MYKHFDGKESAFAKNDNFKRYMSDIRTIGVMSKSDFQRYFKKYKESGDLDAFNKLITGNLLYAVKFASRYMGCGIPYNDLISICTEGLIHALKKYDDSKGCTFLYYANYFMANQLNLARWQNMPIKFTTKIKKDISRGEKLSKYATFIETNVYDPEKDEIVHQIGNQDDSLDPDRSFKYDELKDLMSRCLSKRERYVLKSYFGIGRTERNLNELASVLGCSHQCVSQIYKRAIKKLQSNVNV